MEVCVIKPASMEDTREIADTLLAGCTVVLNLEGIDVDIFQSNHEGALVDAIQQAYFDKADGIIINPGGYAYYSVAILEALQLCGVPAVEVMLHDPSGRESFRNTDVVSFGCQGRFAGEGISGYLHAAAYLTQLLRLDGSAHTHLVM